jgi:3'(2'), 5'-bisphosphate nucleotidase
VTEPDVELEQMVAVALEAAALVVARLAEPLQVSLKGPGDFVTNADVEANALICARLGEAFPGTAIVAEESAAAPAAPEPAGDGRDRVLYVDPIDGTREFVERRPEFAVMIGLAEQGRATAGVVVLPAVGLLLAGRLGAGAFQQLTGGPRQPLVVSATDDPAATRFVVSRARPPAALAPLRQRLGAPPAEQLGSVGAKVARLVLAQADAYLHVGRGTKLWDCCAPEAILCAAGGRMTDLDGRTPDYSSGRARASVDMVRGVLASNGRLHAALLAALAELAAR